MGTLIELAGGKAVSPHEARQISPLQLAYIGDIVYDLFVGTRMLSGETHRSSAREWHKRSVAIVCAHAQSRAMERVFPTLTDNEADVARRGRNARAASMPRNANPAEYSQATSLEALIGYLYISGQTERLQEVIALALGDEDGGGDGQGLCP